MSGLIGRPLLIFPCNGNGIEALNCLGTGYQVIGFVDDAATKQAGGAHGYPVFDRQAFARWPEASVLAVPGGPASYLARRQIMQGLGISADRFTSVIHPMASVSPLARIGRNVLIMAGVVVTSDAVIGDHVCILPNTVIHHEVLIGAWSLIGSNVTVAGGSVIGENCYIGSGCSIINGVRIGDAALLGLGSNVIRNVPAGVRVAGNPAREI